MTLVTAFGCEIIERCPPLTLVTLAWARVAMSSWTFGGMAWSSVPRTYQLGIVFQATGPDLVVSALNVAGACVAASAQALALLAAAATEEREPVRSFQPE